MTANVRAWNDDFEGALPSIEDLTVRPDRDPADVIEQAREQLGIGAPRRRYQPPDRDVSGLREELGLR